MMNRESNRIPIPPLSCASWTKERSGSCGQNVNWRLNPETGVLSVSGLGPMEDYESEQDVPWHRGRELVRKVVIEDGVTTVGDLAFKGCSELSVVSMAETVKIVGVKSFKDCKMIVKLALSNKLEVICHEAFFDCVELRIVYLPRSLRSIEGSAFGGSSQLSEVFYEGTVSEWKKIFISRSCRGNERLLDALLHPADWREGDADGQASGTAGRQQSVGLADRYNDIVDTVREAIKQGGDGRLHILVPKLYAEGIRSKTGDCTLILFPRGKLMMVDTGVSECGAQVVGLLSDLGVAKLDYFVLTHPHSDHIGGAMSIFNYLYQNEGKICRYYHTGHRNNVVDAAFQEALRVRGTEINADIAAGDQWKIDGVIIDVLAPDAERRAFGTGPEELNNISLVTRFAYGKSSYLTAGDLYIRQERWMAQQYGSKLAADVTKASHHCLPSSTSREWLEAVSPKIVLAHTDDVGCAKVIQRIYDQGADYYCTGVDGMLYVSMDDQANYQIISQYDSVLRKYVNNAQK